MPAACIVVRRCLLDGGAPGEKPGTHRAADSDRDWSDVQLGGKAPLYIWPGQTRGLRDIRRIQYIGTSFRRTGIARTEYVGFGLDDKCSDVGLDAAATVCSHPTARTGHGLARWPPEWQCGGREEGRTRRSERSRPDLSRAAGRAGAFITGDRAADRMKNPLILLIFSTVSHQWHIWRSRSSSAMGAPDSMGHLLLLSARLRF